MAIAKIREAAQEKVRKGPPCDVCAFIASLDESEADDLRSLLADSNVRYSALADALNADPDYDFTVTGSTLSRHARGLCAARTKLRG